MNLAGPFFPAAQCSVSTIVAERINNKLDLNKIPNEEQLKEECFPEITKYIYFGLDREKRKASRDKGNMMR